MSTLSTFQAAGTTSMIETTLSAQSSLSSVRLTLDVIGMQVVSEQGEDLGRIEDVVVHPGAEAAHAVLSFGGWMGMGTKLFAMPWATLRAVTLDAADPDSAGALVLPLTRHQLMAAQGFDKAKWPSFASADWVRDVKTFDLADVSAEPRQYAAATRAADRAWRMTELKGADVRTQSGDKLAGVRDVAIDGRGRVAYAVLSFGGFMGIGEHHRGVPWEALSFSFGGDSGDKRLVTLATTRDDLELAPEFKSGKGDAAHMCDATWVGRLYAHYSQPRYWTGTGTPFGKV